MLTFKNYIPTPHQASELLDWLSNDIRLDDNLIVNEVLKFVAENYSLEFQQYITKEYLADKEQIKKSQPKGWLFLLFVRSSSSLRLDSSPLWPQPDYRQVWQRASLALLLLTPSEIFTCLRLREYFFSCLGSRREDSRGSSSRVRPYHRRGP